MGFTLEIEMEGCGVGGGDGDSSGIIMTVMEVEGESERLCSSKIVMGVMCQCQASSLDKHCSEPSFFL